MTVVTNLKQIYDIDAHLWLLETIELLKQKKFNELDLENLIEELESLTRKDKNTVKSLLEQIIRHLLLLQYWSEESDITSHHWSAEIYSFRNQLKDELTTNLKKYLQEERLNIYQKALGYVQRKTKFKVNFPTECPYTLEQLLDENYL
jgi:Domain of unknown function DUF29